MVLVGYNEMTTHQRERNHLPNKELVHDYGKINAWEICELAESERIHIPSRDKHSGDPDCFLHLLFSNSSTSVEYGERDNLYTWAQRVVLRLWGPVTEDGRRLHTEFTLYRYDLDRLGFLKEDRYKVVRRLHELGGGGEGFREACKALRVSRLGLS
jgi:hypothetical protein